MCCKQCADAAQRDPAGMDLRVLPCSKYPPAWNGGPGVDDRCRALFEKLKTTIGQCQESAEKS
jgi:hypothetical protein